MTSKIPLEIIKDLRCRQCSKFLSCPPVHVVPGNGSVLCGRCRHIAKEIFRNYPYEALASTFLYPCSNWDIHCPKVFAWNRSLEHESRCKYDGYCAVFFTDTVAFFSSRRKFPDSEDDIKLFSVPDNILPSLKCVHCDGFLNCEPVFLYPDGQSVCGQCGKFPPKNAERNLVYEKIAQIFKFPCVHWKTGCTKRVPFGIESIKHERECPYGHVREMTNYYDHMDDNYQEVAMIYQPDHQPNYSNPYPNNYNSNRQNNSQNARNNVDNYYPNNNNNRNNVETRRIYNNNSNNIDNSKINCYPNRSNNINSNNMEKRPNYSNNNNNFGIINQNNVPIHKSQSVNNNMNNNDNSSLYNNNSNNRPVANNNNNNNNRSNNEVQPKIRKLKDNEKERGVIRTQFGHVFGTITSTTPLFAPTNPKDANEKTILQKEMVKSIQKRQKSRQRITGNNAFQRMTSDDESSFTSEMNIDGRFKYQQNRPNSINGFDNQGYQHQEIEGYYRSRSNEPNSQINQMNYPTTHLPVPIPVQRRGSNVSDRGRKAVARNDSTNSRRSSQETAFLKELKAKHRMRNNKAILEENRTKY